MKLSRASAEMLLPFAVTLLLAPGIASLIPTPYGLSPPELWLAVLYLGAAAWAVLALCVRVLGPSHAPFRSTARKTLLVVLLAIGFVLVVLLPFGALVAAYYLFEVFPGGSAWVLFNKYVGHIASSAFDGLLWVISLCLVTFAVGLAIARGPVQSTGHLGHEV